MRLKAVESATGPLAAAAMLARNSRMVVRVVIPASNVDAALAAEFAAELAVSMLLSSRTSPAPPRTLSLATRIRPSEKQRVNAHCSCGQLRVGSYRVRHATAREPGARTEQPTWHRDVNGRASTCSRFAAHLTRSPSARLRILMAT
jgi:hypothetical protein